MNIISIEPTPSPNTMKINLDQALPSGTSYNFKNDDHLDQAPDIIQNILEIDGVKGVYHVLDFMAIERNGRYSWEDILPSVRSVFGEEETKATLTKSDADAHFGEVNVQIQTFKDIPIQVKLTTSSEEKRFGLPERFIKAMEAAHVKTDNNYILLRKWKDGGIRYGDLDELGHQITEELDAAYTEDRLSTLVKRALEPKAVHNPIKRIKLTADMLNHDDWKKRYQLLEQMEDPTLDDLPVLEKALSDSNTSVRRLAVVYIGMIEDKKVLPLLYKGLQDRTATVRRTAGDCLSDLGFKEAQHEVAKTLQDKNRIVRWRAAMFLYEVGDEAVLPALKEAADDPEFEVRLQIEMAIERIAGGEEAKGSIWRQMTNARNMK